MENIGKKIEFNIKLGNTGLRKTKFVDCTPLRLFYTGTQHKLYNKINGITHYDRILSITNPENFLNILFIDSTQEEKR